MPRQNRRHDKVLRQYLEAVYEREQAELDGVARARVERLAVRERQLAAAVRWVRLELGLPEEFDPTFEAARLGVASTASRRTSAKRTRPTDATAVAGQERPRVRPVAAPPRPPAVRERADIPPELIEHSARYCGRRAADEVLEHRAALTPEAGDGEVAPVWPARPLDRTATGEIYAGSAGRVMGDLVAAASEGETGAEQARVAVRSYVDEFTTCVVAALEREHAAATEPDAADGARSGTVADVRRALADAACARIAVEARATGRGRAIAVADVAALLGAEGGSDPAAADSPRPPELTATGTLPRTGAGGGRLRPSA